MKIATLNLCYNTHRWEERFPLIVQAILDHDIDLIGLQEVWTQMGNRNQAQVIADAVNQQLGEEIYQVFFTDSTRENSRMGIAILSRLAVQEFNWISLPGPWRVAQLAEFSADGKEFGFINTHFHNLPAKEETIRMPQAKRLMEWVQAQEFPCLIGGDFNAPPERNTIQHIKETHSSAYETIHGKEPALTCPTPLIEPRPTEIVDYLFYDPTVFHVKTCELILTQPAAQDDTLYASDHYGMLAEIEMLKAAL